MSPVELRALAAGLREAGEALRRRPAAEVLASLAAVLERWRDPHGPERRRLERGLPEATGFSPEVVREGLALGLEPWSGERFLRWAADELGPRPGRGAPLTAVLLAGSIPLPTLLAVIAPLAVRSPALVRTAARDPLTARLVADSIAAVDAELGRCVAVAGFAHDDAACLEAFLEADTLVATGSEAALDAVAARLPTGRRLLRHGHGVSLALLGPAATREALEGLALDAALWDQQGCLSPHAVFVAGDTDACRARAAELAAGLESLARRLPRGRLDPAAAARIAHERADAELRAAAGTGARLHAGAGWTVVCEVDPAPRPLPGGRFLRVCPVAEERLEAELAPWSPFLAGAALAGFGPRGPALRTRLEKLGATRVCRPGRLQTPLLDWPRDGLAPLASLLDARPAPESD